MTLVIRSEKPGQNLLGSLLGYSLRLWLPYCEEVPGEHENLSGYSSPPWPGPAPTPTNGQTTHK